MTIPDNPKDQAAYHMMLAEMHRLRAIMLNLSTLQDPSTAEGPRDHFTREQTLTLGKLTEWRSHRSEIYRQATDDFNRQFKQSPG